MALNMKYFAPLGGQSSRGLAPQEFGYRSTDSLATMRAAGYFNGVLAMLEIGDIIRAEVVDDVAAPTDVTAFATLVVKDKSTTAIDVSDPLGGFGPGSGGGQASVSIRIADLSADANYYIPPPVTGKLVGMTSAIDGAVSTADITVTASIGGVAVTGGVLTIATAASAAGDVDLATPTALNDVTKGGTAVKLAVAGGGSGGAPAGTITLLFEAGEVDSD